MGEDELYEKAIESVKRLVDDVKEQCEHFAEMYDYEKEWVFGRFKEELKKQL